MDNRLQEEAQQAARTRTSAVWLQVAAAISSASSWPVHHEPRLLTAAVGALLGAGIARLGAIRWTARARWYADTPDWATRLDEAPTVRLFPRVATWLHDIQRSRTKTAALVVTVSVSVATAVTVQQLISLRS